MGTFKSYSQKIIRTIWIITALSHHVYPISFGYSRESEPIISNINIQPHSPQFDPGMIPSVIINSSQIWASDNDLLGLPLNPEEFVQGQSLSDEPLIFSDFNDPIFIANLLEGDIQIPNEDQYFQLVSHTVFNTIPPRNAIKDMAKKWTNKVIPYTISNSYSQTDRQKMARAFQEIHSKTCIRLIPRTNERDYVHITKGNGCSSSVGKVGSRQSVSLGTGCVHHGVIIHELMHAMGFWHEQSRSDRDTKISIQWQNIRSGMEYNFQKYDWSIIQNLGTKYDPGSLMHYGKYAFTKRSGQPTIISKDNSAIGQRNHLSQIDIKKINSLYECNGVNPKPPKPVKPEVKPTEVKPLPGPTSTCEDSNEHCSYWAAINECSKNPSYMHASCAKSCQKCSSSASKCRDKATNCKKWKGSGYCTSHAGYMSKTCPHSCGICKNPSPSSTCKDDNIYCKEWATLGECIRNPSYMLFSCRKSCSIC